MSKKSDEIRAKLAELMQQQAEPGAPPPAVDDKTTVRRAALMRALAAAQTRTPATFRRGKGAVR